MNSQQVLTESEHIQEDMHRHIEMLVSANKKCSYQDAANIYLITKLAELQLQINDLAKRVLPLQ
jgi:hypothetical protein